MKFLKFFSYFLFIGLLCGCAFSLYRSADELKENAKYTASIKVDRDYVEVYRDISRQARAVMGELNARLPSNAGASYFVLSNLDREKKSGYVTLVFSVNTTLAHYEIEEMPNAEARVLGWWSNRGPIPEASLRNTVAGNKF